MNDCQDVTMREALPELLHGRLAEGERRLVEAHVRDCAECTDELTILRAVLGSAREPAIDVSRIVAMIAPYQGAEVTSTTTTVVGGGAAQRDRGVIPLRPHGVRRSRFSRMQLAAAFALAAVGISTATLVARQRQQSPSSSVAAVHSAATSSDRGVALVATVDLSDAELATLINAMNSMPALPPAEPEPIAPAVDGGV